MRKIFLRSAGAARIAGALSIFLISAANCGQGKLVRSDNPGARNSYRPASPGSLSSYIRTVLKISAEKGPQLDEKLQRAREQNPDLARQAEQSSAHPTNLETGLRLAESYVKAGLYLPAYEVYQRLRAAAEPRAEIELGLAGIWDKWQDYSLARTHAEYALEIDSKLPEAWNLLARIHLHRGDFEAAAVSFQKAINLQASNAVFFADAGYTYLRLGRLDSARACLEKALSLDGTITQAHNHLGIVLARRGELDLALTHFNQTSEPAVALNNLGAVCLEQGKWEDARKFFSQALSLKPDYEKAAAHLRATDALAPAQASVSIADGTGMESAEQQAAGAPPTRVSVSILPDVSQEAPKASVSQVLPPAEMEAEFVAETREILLGKGPYLTQEASPNRTPAPSPLREYLLYHPTLDARLRSLAERLTEPLPPQAPGRYPKPTAPAPGPPGASLSVAALRWQEPLLDPQSPAQASLDWSTSPHSDHPSAFYVPSLVDILFTWCCAIGLFLGLLLAGGTGAVMGMAAGFLLVVSRLVQ